MGCSFPHDSYEIRKFVDFLPEPSPKHLYAYQLMLITRASSKVKQELGMRFKEHVVDRSFISLKADDWRDKLYHTVLRYCFLKHNSELYYTANGRPLPSQVLAVMIEINPCKYVDAWFGMLSEMARRARDAINAGQSNPEIANVLKKPHLLFSAECMRHARTLWYVLDVDEDGLIHEVVDKATNFLGFKPPVVWTKPYVRGHVMIPIWLIKNPKEFWGKGGFLEQIRNLGNIELKKDMLEPLPGCPYKAYGIVRFDPGDLD